MIPLTCPDELLDAPVIGLVRVVNQMPGLRTFASCGGHENPGPCAASADWWWVSLQPDLADDEIAPTSEAWLSLELVACAVAQLQAAGRTVRLDSGAMSMEIGEPGHTIAFSIQGRRVDGNGIEPDELASKLTRVVGR